MPAASDGVAERARGMIERQVGTLIRLVDELLDVSRINRGKIQLRKEPVQLAAAVERAVEAARPLIEAKSHILTVRLPEQPVWLEADPTRLEQIIVNLLNNAAKYTEAGGKLDIDAHLAEGRLVLRVRDNGVGIAPDMLPRIFEMFTQVDHSLDRALGGLGIGLTLVRSLVTLHGGDIAGHSDGLGLGSTFTVRFPLLAQPPATPTAVPALPAGEAPPLRVIVVDDNADAGDSLGMLLRLYQHRVEVVRSGKTALDLFPAFRPDVVLLDIGLPEMDGYQVAHRLRQLPGGADAYLIAVTGYGQEEHRRRAAEAGFDHHLVKPLDPTALETALRRPHHNGRA
jgi:CheY-like chemotaxis protein